MIPGAALALVLSASQVDALNLAYSEGSYYGIGLYFEAVVLVESSACLHKHGDDNTSLGCSQLKLETARTICRCKISDKRLIRDNSANLRIGAQFLSRCFNQFWPDRKRSIYCYNAGIPQASKASSGEILKSSYVSRVEQAIEALGKIRKDDE